MIRIYAGLAVLAVLVGAGLAFAGWPHTGAASVASNDDRLIRAYAQVRTGMPFAELAGLGFNTAKAERLSRLALIERFMPKDSAAFDTLNPVVKSCYIGPGDCTAYIFDDYADQTVLLVQGGRVVWKVISESMVARNTVAMGESVTHLE